MSEGHVAFEYEAKNVSPETLATLGEGHIAYVKQIRSEDVPGLFPEAPKIAPGHTLFALHAADMTADIAAGPAERHGRRDRRLRIGTGTQVRGLSGACDNQSRRRQ